MTMIDEPTLAFVRHEHQDLRPGLYRIHDLALRATHLPTPELSVGVLDVLAWTAEVLGPHMAWEEASLYPEFDAVAATPWATRLMRFEHHQIHELVVQLRARRADLVAHDGVHDPAQVMASLVALETLVRAHVEREERELIPLLDQGPPSS